MSVKLRSVALAVSALALLTLSGCGGGDPLNDAKSSTGAKKSTPSPAPTPSAASGAPLTLPDAATKHTTDGGVEFTKFYFDALNRAFETGEIDAVAKVTDPNCILCRQTLGDIAFAFSRGRVDGGKVTISGVKSVSAGTDLNTISLKYDEDRYAELDPDGTTLFSSPAKTGLDFLLQVAWDSKAQAWVMRQIKGNAVAPAE